MPSQYILLAGQELRVRIPWSLASEGAPPSSSPPLRLCVLKDPGLPSDQPQPSKAEIFGAELVPEHKYEFSPGRQFAVYTRQGCTVHVEHDSGEEASWCYLSEVSSMRGVTDIHTMLHQRRGEVSTLEIDKGSITLGPRVLVCGGEGVGKSTIVTCLANYAARSGFPLNVVDLDVENPMMALPETVAVAHVSSQIHPEEGFCNHPYLAYFFGFTDVSKNTALFAQCLDRTAMALQQRMAKNRKERWAGYVVNCPKLPENNDVEMLEILGDIVRTFDISLVLSIGDDNVRHAVKRACLRLFPRQSHEATSTCVNPNETRMSMHTLEIVHGVCPRRAPEERLASVRRYFRGTTTTPVTSVVKVMKEEATTFVKLGAVAKIQDNGILPIGEESILDTVSYERKEFVELAQLGNLCAVTFVREEVQGQTVSEDDIERAIKEAHVSGYVYVQSISLARKEVEILTAVENFPAAKFDRGEDKYGMYLLLGEERYASV